MSKELPDFVEPTSQEEAQKRLFDLKSEVNRLQHNLGDRDVRHPDGRRMNDREWWAWKKGAKEFMQSRIEELNRLKTWMSANEKKLKRQIRGEVGEVKQACLDLKDLVKKVTSNAYGMELRIAELIAENNALHKRLQEYELQNTNPAPDHGREGWRQDDNAEKEAPHAL